MRLARILIGKARTESFIAIKNGRAITREELILATGFPLPRTVIEFLTGDYFHLIEQRSEKLPFRHRLTDFQILTPIPRPSKIICLCYNYKDQDGWLRFGKSPPTEPVFHFKPQTALADPFGIILCPTFVERLDYEGELAVIIGKETKDISQEEAIFSVSGYMVFNDISARDIQVMDVQFTRSKSFDTFAPCGPWITSRSEIADPNNLRLVTRVNREVRQDSSTANMVLSIPQIVSKLSKVMTLEPGDVISTGTPMGTILSNRGKQPWLKDGDMVQVEVQGLGSISNEVRFYKKAEQPLRMSQRNIQLV